MGLSVLLDSVILIDHLNHVPAAHSYLSQLDHVWISVITRAEVLAGATARNLAATTQLIDSFPTLPIGPEVADLAAEFRRSHRWRLPDAFQAALAVHHALTLATRNTRDFDPDKHPFVIIPYQLPRQ